ncbi:MAG: ABC transporter, partial [Chlamydiia bacterium]|nr:ABC transporter [Chlamydiia bacterium]
VNNLRGSLTIVVVAHRLSTIRNADRILVFDHGRIVEQGRHMELSRAGGIYASLSNLQFAKEPIRPETVLQGSIAD